MSSAKRSTWILESSPKLSGKFLKKVNFLEFLEGFSQTNHFIIIGDPKIQVQVAGLLTCKLNNYFERPLRIHICIGYKIYTKTQVRTLLLIIIRVGRIGK